MQKTEMKEYEERYPRDLEQADRRPSADSHL